MKYRVLIVFASLIFGLESFAQKKGNEIITLLNSVNWENPVLDSNLIATIEKESNTILKINSLDPDANYCLGKLYFKQAIHLIQFLDYDTDIDKVVASQDRTVELLQKSIPYMKTAYENNPKNKNIINILSDACFSLNDFDCYNEWQLKRIDE